MSIIKAKTLSVGAITGGSSGQTEELDLFFIYKNWNTDIDDATSDPAMEKRFLVHRSNFMYVIDKVPGVKSSLSLYSGNVLLETITTDDYDWSGEQIYTVSDIDNLSNAIYSALQF